MTNAISAESETIRRREAMAPLLAAHLDMVYAAALRQTRDPHMAEDVAQNVFLIAVKKAGHIPQDRTAAWLLKVTRYVALTALRAQRRRAHHEHASAMETSTPADSSQVALEGHLDEALAALGQSDRQLILLRYFQNHPVPEVAAAFRIADNTASQRLGRALDKLRHYLLRRHVDVPLTALGAMLALAVRPAPRALAQRILQAASAGKVSAAAGISLGVFLMTLTTKTALVLAAAAILLLATLAGVYVSRPPTPATPVAAATTRGPGLEALPIVPEEPPAANAAPQYTIIAGTVTDETGKPVANALISQGDPPQLADGYFTTRSDAEGKYALRARVGTELVVAVQIAGYAPELVKQGLVTEKTEPLNFSLKPAQIIQARIVDMRGNPMANLALEPFYWRQAQVLRVYHYEQRQWTGPHTDAAGMLVWKDAPADAVTFYPITDDHHLQKDFVLTPSAAVQSVVVGDPIQVTITALDAETKTALPNFSVTYGRGGDAADADYWGDRPPAIGVNGKYATSLTRSEPYHFFRIEAPGYAPLIEKFKEDQTQVTLAVQLSKTAGLPLEVRDPDGTPAAGATVYVVPSAQNFNLNANTLMFADPRWGHPEGRERTTDASGKIVLADSQDPEARVVVLDDSGYADVLLADAAKSRTLALEAWAKLEGVVYVGTKPAVAQKLQAQYMSPHQGRPYITGMFETTTDAVGRFAFDRLPPSQINVGRLVGANLGTRFLSATISNYVVMTMVAGKTQQVNFGGNGRTLAGRIVDGREMAPEGMVYSLAGLVPQLEIIADFEQKAAALRKLPAAEAQAGFVELAKSPEYAAMQKAQRELGQHSYVFVIGADGVFRAEDVAPGKYTLSVTVTDAKTYKEAGVVSATVIVPEGADGEVVPVGNLPIRPRK